MPSCIPSRVILALLVSVPVPASGEPIRLDQSALGISNIAAVFNTCCAHVAQVFTAGVTGSLVAVSVDIHAEQSQFPLRVAVTRTTRDVLGRVVPDLSQVLAEATIASGSSLIDDRILLDHPFDQHADTAYSVVANYVGAPPPIQGPSLGFWTATPQDTYRRGYPMSFSNGSWIEQLGIDLQFATFAAPTPVPEPSTLLLLTSAGWGLLVARRHARGAHSPARQRSASVVAERRSAPGVEDMANALEITSVQ